MEFEFSKVNLPHLSIYLFVRGSGNVKISNKLELTNKNLSTRFDIIRNCLSHYNAFFYDNPISDRMLFPFIKLFPKKEFKAFEIFLTFMIHWTQPILANFPSLPPLVLDQINIILSDYNFEFAEIVSELGIIHHLWESQLCLFTDILKKDSWLQIFDFIFAYSEFPELFYFVIPSILLQFKSDILLFGKSSLKCNNSSQIDDSKILDNMKEAEKLLYDQELDLISKKIELSQKQQERMADSHIQQDKNSFIVNLLSKIEQLDSKMLILKMIKILKRIYNKELLILKFSKTRSLDNGVDAYYPLFIS